LPDFPEIGEISTPDTVIRRRPDVAAAERQLAVERALVGAAKADYLPRITVGGSAGYTAAEFDALGDRGTFRYAVGPVLSWPALNLGRIKARVDQSRAREREAQARYDQTVLLAVQEIESSLVRYRTARGRVGRIRDAAAASERAAELARLRFTGGVADFLQVLDAERTQLEAQDQLAQSRTEAATAYAALYKALGGSWPNSVTENRP
jgi:outer membrane protein TolC